MNARSENRYYLHHGGDVISAVCLSLYSSLFTENGSNYKNKQQG